MITFPNAKINLGLNIIEKRPDGYHNLETIFILSTFKMRWKSHVLQAVIKSTIFM